MKQFQAYQVDNPQNRYTYATVVVTVEDTNAHRPQMVTPMYGVTIPENSPVGYYVVQVQATDRDEVKNGCWGTALF